MAMFSSRRRFLNTILLGLAGVIAGWTPVVAAVDTTVAPPAEPARPAAPEVLNPNLPTLWIAGDSTAANGGPMATGWGVPLPAFFDLAKINIANRSRGGRSSRTYITEGLWDKVISGVKPGDFVLIQFGHNDSGVINDASRARGSIRSLGDETEEIDNLLTKKHETVHTYGWYMRKMIAETKAKGATPIVLSITTRDEWKEGHVERANGPWSGFAATLARENGCYFIDLTNLIADEYERRGQHAVKKLFPKDSTHTGPEGAEINARLVVAGLRALPGAPLNSVLSARGREVAAVGTNALVK